MFFGLIIFLLQRRLYDAATVGWSCIGRDAAVGRSQRPDEAGRPPPASRTAMSRYTTQLADVWAVAYLDFLLMMIKNYPAAIPFRAASDDGQDAGPRARPRGHGRDMFRLLMMMVTVTVMTMMTMVG